MNSQSLLHSLSLPNDLKNLSLEQYETLAKEIRDELITVCNNCGGHLASNLGIVELTIALHAVFNSPVDKLVFDTTHQCYVHKMLTGRLAQMHTIRQEHGLSGFAKISESEHDAFGAGHASTALSASLGMAHARNILGADNAVVAIIGDATLSGGMAFEAINNVSKLSGNFICILNDNNMSISKPVGNMSTYITQLRTSPTYTTAKDQFERIFKKIPKIGQPLLTKIEKTIDRMRSLILDFKIGVIFEEFGFRYLGPIDGHNIPVLMGALNYAKSYNGPIMIHVITTKGKGHIPAENDPIKFHGVAPKKATLPPTLTPPAPKIPTYTEVFGRTVIDIANHHPHVTIITPAMKSGSGLDDYATQFPDRFFDVGIAEEHAITFAAGLSRAGILPIVSIYSTFLQRGYDQLVHDVCLQKLPMVLALDRAGLVGEDGATHHGVFDYAFELHIPNITILAPRNGHELSQMLWWAVTSQKIVSIRYPKGPIPDTYLSQAPIPDILHAEVLRPFSHTLPNTPTMGLSQNAPDVLFIEGRGLPRRRERSEAGVVEPFENRADGVFCDSPKIAVIAVGSMVDPAIEACENSLAATLNCALINLRSVKPLDLATLVPILKEADYILTIEEGSKIGGVGSYIQQEIRLEKTQHQWHTMGIEDEFVDHGKIPSLRSHYGLTASGILDKILTLSTKHAPSHLPTS